MNRRIRRRIFRRKFCNILATILLSNILQKPHDTKDNQRLLKIQKIILPPATGSARANLKPQAGLGLSSSIAALRARHSSPRPPAVAAPSPSRRPRPSIAGDRARLPTRAMNARGFLTTSAQVGASMGLGDLACQALERRRRTAAAAAATSGSRRRRSTDASSSDGAATAAAPLDAWDAERSRIMVTTGFCASAPWTHLQFHGLERWAPGLAGPAIVRKVAACTALAPIPISILFASVLAQQGGSLREIKDKLSAHVLPAWQAGSLYWPAVLTLNFKYVPVKHRPLVTAISWSVWSVYLSYMANKGEEPKDATLLLEDDPVPLSRRRSPVAAT